MKTFKQHIAESEQLDEVIITGLIGMFLGIVITDAIGLLGLQYNPNKGLWQNLKDARWAGVIELKQLIKSTIENAKFVAQVKKLENDPEVIEMMKNNMSGRSFKPGKKNESVALLHKKLKKSDYAEIRKLLDVIKDKEYKVK